MVDRKKGELSREGVDANYKAPKQIKNIGIIPQLEV